MHCTIVLFHFIITHVNGNRSVMFCLSVFPRDIPKADAPRITKLDTQMVHDETWKLTILGSRSRVMKTVSVWVFALF